MLDIVMRDDLHRTVAVPAPWRTVLRYAPNKVDRLARLPNALQEAVRVTLKNSLSPGCMRALRAALSHGLGDMFGSDAVGAAIARCADNVVTGTDRELYDCVRAAAAFKRQDRNIFAAAMREITNRAVDRYCEQLVAQVRVDHPKDAAQLRGYLDTARLSCNFSALVDANGDIAPGKGRGREAINLEEVVGR